MSRLTIIRNPDYEGEPRLLIPECHDRTPFLTVGCGCGYRMHLHESQFYGVPDGAVIDTRCHQCRRPLELALDDVRAAFAQMRKDGWIE